MSLKGMFRFLENLKIGEGVF